MKSKPFITEVKTDTLRICRDTDSGREWLTPQMTWSAAMYEGLGFELWERAKADAILDVVLGIKREQQSSNGQAVTSESDELDPYDCKEYQASISNAEVLMHDSDEIAVCRGCGRKLNGRPCYMGGDAYHPDTGERCPRTHYGGFVCSEDCDRRVCRDMEGSFPGAGRCGHLSQGATDSIHRNWAT